MANIHDTSNNTVSNFMKQSTLYLKGETGSDMIVMRLQNPIFIDEQITHIKKKYKKWH